MIDTIPAHLASLPQWCLWREVVRNGDKTKVPFQPSGSEAKTNDPSTWHPLDDCQAALESGDYNGLGFVFAAGGGIVGIDLDGCRDPESGELASWARGIVEQIGSYTEVSPSGTGVKIFALGYSPFDKGKNQKLDFPSVSHKTAGIEIYHKTRFFAFTGEALDDFTEMRQAQDAIDEVCRQYWPARKPVAPKARTNGLAIDPSAGVKRARSYIAKMPGAVSGKGGHPVTFAAACAICKFGLPWDDAWAVLLEFNERCEPPWSEWELNHKLEDAYQEVGDERFPDRDPQGNGKPEKEEMQNCMSSDEPEGDHRDACYPIIVNAEHFVGFGEDKPKWWPMPMARVLEGIRKVTEDWPRAVDGTLFVPRQPEGIDWITSPAALFGWLAARSGHPVNWMRITGACTKEEVFAELKRTSQRYDAVESLPHVPEIRSHYYACGKYPRGNGDAVRGLLDRFCPASDIDRDLLLSALLTTFWGGPPSSRPAFLITSQAGRGVGKSTAAKMIASVAGGYLSFDKGDDWGRIKGRLLSSEGLRRRIALLDNVKSPRFSWAELEGLITADVISGHRLFEGEGRRPNVLTWMITLNGASLSTDMAQRCVIIHLARPERLGSWESDTAAYIDQHRDQIIGDLLAMLEGPADTLARFTRWAAWEEAILARLPDPSEAQAVISERQAAVDVEADDAELIEDAIRQRLENLHYDAEDQSIHIPTQVITEWVNKAMNDRATTTKVGRQLKQYSEEGRFSFLTPNKCKTRPRGFVWMGSAKQIQTDIQDRIDRQNGKAYGHESWHP